MQLSTVNRVMGDARALISIPLGVIRDRFNLRKIYLFGVAILVFVPLLYAVAPSWQVISLAILLSGLHDGGQLRPQPTALGQGYREGVVRGNRRPTDHARPH